MGVGEDVSADSNEAKELTPEEAKKKREDFLALAAQYAKFDEEVDSADSTMVTLILPGG